MRPRLIINLFLSTLPLLASAQKIMFQLYTVNDGLVANPVRRVLQDKEGFIWVATWEGLSKYDGYKFTNYTTANGLSFNLVNDLYEAPNGKLYIAENNGTLDVIVQNRITRDTAHTVCVANAFFKTDKGQVWVTTDNKGFVKFTMNGWDTTGQQPIVNSTDFAVLNDSLQVITDGGLQPHLIDKNRRLFSKPVLHPFPVTTVRQDKQGRVWFCTAAGLKLVARHQERNQPLHLDSLPPLFQMPILKQENVYDFFEDADSNYWISMESGLIHINKSTGSQQFIPIAELPVNRITRFFQDREKNIWMCSERGLVKVVLKNNIQHFTTEAGLLTDEVRTIMPGNERTLYLGNVLGCVQMDMQKNALTILSHNEYLVTSFQNKNRPPVSFLTQHALYRTDANNQALITALPGYFFTCGLQDNGGNYIIGTNQGIVIKTRTKTFSLPHFPYRVTTLLFDKVGALWVGTWQQGLFRLKLQYTGDSIAITAKDFSYLVPDKNIRSSFQDSKSNIWIGTRYSGAVKLQPLSKDHFAVIRIDQKEGLNSTWITAFTEDQQGVIWMGTFQGLVKLIPTSRTYRVFDFSRINRFFGTVYCLYANGHDVWCGGNFGLIRFRDDQLDTLSAPVVFITSVQSHVPIDADANRPVVLSHNSNQIYFEFSATSFINEKEVRYHYRLIGAADTNWSVPAAGHAVSFASLEPGTYRFEVRAIGWNGLPGKSTLYAFIVQPAFWQTLPFYLLCALLLAGLIYALYRYRIGQLLRLQEVRDGIALDLHDDIGSSLTNINILSELSSKNLHQPEKAQLFLERIAEEIGATGQAMDDIVWSVNAKNDSLEETYARMRRYAAELFEATGVACHLNFEESGGAQKLVMEKRRDLFLLYKEALNNIYKHAAATEVWVHLSKEHHILYLKIRDNGVGFDTTKATHRNGLKNIQARVKKWKGAVTIESKAGQGTALFIQFPL